MIAKIMDALENSVAWALNCELTFGQAASLIGYIKELHTDIDRLTSEVARLERELALREEDTLVSAQK